MQVQMWNLICAITSQHKDRNCTTTVPAVGINSFYFSDREYWNETNILQF